MDHGLTLRKALMSLEEGETTANSLGGTESKAKANTGVLRCAQNDREKRRPAIGRTLERSIANSQRMRALHAPYMIIERSHDGVHR